ncbi:TetR/AcrR family transcriptional regulator [Bacillus cytotoxicus]|uniref:Transcriptional regulator, TetR family n=1 Tax=Bacillus cytotoxicus TaxID=580165 RepID=A0AAX2CKA8_9BACI|nr:MULTISPECIES: TetR/AcrR family transcriptional regulator [Bacillus cereus group]QTR70230.1 TetR/AcrR family transcriptional regulator [Bacillus cytotoxicus]QTR78985.1 TetR/AcrR family transcriptional regulator [Bacillus cytotoxicus]QTR84895.1 TetR/AcrR family transcriptional regulator [Bacillus cytotoxicus]QTR88697.1 TetR/AcrR family transcriptional regulator [Bacillus cytotoxicus]SCM00051.1 Transcriptional regulator, TetR family [Bacillus cytotoxicus]
MTANRIKAVALSHFARYGYEGTSLANIAQKVGIKKPSIYAHFKGKEELYFICLEEALQKDLQCFTDDIEFLSESPTETLLINLLKGYAKRFGESEESMFWLRTSYFPPDAFREQIIEKANAHIEKIREILFPIFKRANEQGELHNIEIKDALEAYLCLLDGLMVELLYAGFNRFETRLKASWSVFWRGLSK